MSKHKDTKKSTAKNKEKIAEKFKYGKYMPYVIFIFSVLLYANTLNNGYVMDDGAMITDHATVKQGYKGIKQLFKESSVYGATKENYGTYRPITMASFAFELGFYGFNPEKNEWPVKQQRITQILLYALCCLMLYIVLKRLLQNYSPWLAVIAALLFAAHPVHVEVGAFIKSRDEVLSLLFILLSVFYLFRYFDFSQSKHRIYSHIFFFLALFTKESSVAFVIIIPLMVYFFTEKNMRDNAMVNLPNFFSVLIYLAVRNNVLDANSGFMPVINNTLVEAKGNFALMSASIMNIMLEYVKLIFFPAKLTWDYGYNQVPLQNWSNLMVIISLLIHLFFAFVAIKGLKQKSVISFGLLFYALPLSLSANIFVLISAVMAERFLFLPSIGFCLIVAFLIMKYINKDIKSHKINIVIPVLVLTVLSLYSFKVVNRNKEWKSNFTLFKSGAEVSTESYRTNSAYAFELLRAGEAELNPQVKKAALELSLKHFEKAISIYDKQYLDYYNLGVVKNHLGDTAGSYQATLKSFQLNPKYHYTTFNLGVHSYMRKDYKQALAMWLETHRLMPYFNDVDFKVGMCYQLLGDYINAIPYYELNFRRYPNSYDVVTNLANCYKSAGQMDKYNYFAALSNKLKPKQ